LFRAVHLSHVIARSHSRIFLAAVGTVIIFAVFPSVPDGT
jgi:hypothetical protein